MIINKINNNHNSIKIYNNLFNKLAKSFMNIDFIIIVIYIY